MIVLNGIRKTEPMTTPNRYAENSGQFPTPIH